MASHLDAHRIQHPVRSPRRGIRALAVVAAAALAVGVAACTPTPAPEGSSGPVEIPGTPVGRQTQWVLDEINSAAVADEGEFEHRFDPEMFEEVPVADLRAIFGQMQTARPWTPTSYEGTETQARVRIESSAAAYDMSVSVADDGRMDGLFFGMPQPDRTPATSWDELREQLDAAPYDVSLQVSDGVGDPEILIGDAASAPIGSVVKLYVLGAVVDAVAAGSLTWESPLTIDAEVRSLPTGELQDLPDGSTVSVLEAAQKMIGISDNTATDILIRAVGRDAVAAALADMGQADPGVNAPFATTREFFWVGWGDPVLRARWTDADIPGREAILAAVPAGVPEAESLDWTVAAWQAGVDWFATPDDIARAHFALQERATTEAGEPVRGILSANPGIEFGDEWTYVAFKGGSSVGVLAGSWYLERDGAEPLVLTLLARSGDPEALADPTITFGFVEDAAALLAAE